MHAPRQEITGGHDGPRGGGSHQSSSEFGLQPERHAPAGPTCMTYTSALQPWYGSALTFEEGINAYNAGPYSSGPLPEGREPLRCMSIAGSFLRGACPA